MNRPLTPREFKFLEVNHIDMDYQYDVDTAGTVWCGENIKTDATYLLKAYNYITANGFLDLPPKPEITLPAITFPFSRRSLNDMETKVLKICGLTSTNLQIEGTWYDGECILITCNDQSDDYASGILTWY